MVDSNVTEKEIYEEKFDYKDNAEERKNKVLRSLLADYCTYVVAYWMVH